MNLTIRGSLEAESRADAMTFRARWQTAVETVSGYELQKLRLEFAPLSERLTSTHGSNDNDRSVNIVRPSYLLVSA